LRKACGVTDISSKNFVGVSAFITRRSRTLQGDTSVFTWGFLNIGSEMCKCFFEDLPEHIVGGGTFRKWVQFRPCSMDKTTKVRREGLPVIWDVVVNLLFIVNQIDGFILA
jgi:hypothetical protein